MARRLIGLDIGTNAVTLAQVSPGNPPSLERFGQVAMPPDAMREGEVVDDRALIEAVVRLRTEVGLKKEPVRLGLASPRAVVRQVELPSMSRDDLAGALKYQAADLIPIPMDEAVLDFAILDKHQGEDGELMTVLLVAAHAAPTARLKAAVESAGFSVAAVDLLPLALIRALPHASLGAEQDGAEGIVSFGGGVTAIAVHEAGTPRFVRVLGTGGRVFTEAIAAELRLPFEAAEALKRQLGPGGDEVLQRARNAMERPLAMLLDEVRSSLDYYRNQPNVARLARVVVTGGGSQLHGIADRLGSLVGVPVEAASPRSQLEIGDIGFPESEYTRLDPYLPASVGLALGGAGIGTVIDLAPRGQRRAKNRSSEPASTLFKPVAAVAAGLIVLLGVPTYLAHQALSDKKDEHTAIEAQNEELEASIAEMADVKAAAAEVDALEAQVADLLSNDVSWSNMLQGVAKTMPASAWLTTFQGQVTAPVATPSVAPAPTESGSSSTSDDGADATAPPAPTGLQGEVTFAANARSYPDVAAWLRSVGDPAVFPALTNLWVSSANAATGTEAAQAITFSSAADLTDAARSNRLAQFQGEDQ